jgi:type IV pilus assembly protein PilX
MCLRAEDGEAPVWRTIDFADDSGEAHTVPYGHFTGMAFQSGHGALPAKPPRYIIELLPYTREGQGAGPGDLSYFYRVTAAGFGMRPATLVVLQTYYRKEGR